MAQCVWWLAFIICLESGLIIHIDNLRIRAEKPCQNTGTVNRSIPEEDHDSKRQANVLQNCEQCLYESKRLRGLAALKATGKTQTGCINPVKSSRRILKSSKKEGTKNYYKTEGIDLHEINRRKSAEQCLRCAWPADRKGSHRVKNCVRPIKLDKGTANYPQAKLPKAEIFETSGNKTSEEEDRSNEEYDLWPWTLVLTLVSADT